MAHRAVREAVAGNPVVVGVSIPPLLAATQIRVQFRPLGETQFYAAPLLPQGDPYTFFGEIPAAATANSVQIDYFIEALDARGFLLESVGSPAQPISIMVQRASESAEDAMASSTRRDRSQRSPGARNTDRTHRVHLALGGGTGVGLATSPPNVYTDFDLNPGLASSPLHLAFEVGIAVSPAVEILPFTRMQLVFLETSRADITPSTTLAPDFISKAARDTERSAIWCTSVRKKPTTPPTKAPCISGPASAECSSSPSSSGFSPPFI